MTGAEHTVDELGRHSDGGRDGGGQQTAERQGENHRSRGVETANRTDVAMDQGSAHGRAENGADSDRRTGGPGFRGGYAHQGQGEEVGSR